MRKRYYKVIPCVHSGTGKKGYKIVDQKGNNYCPGTGATFIVYYDYQSAEDICEHLNGEGKVWGLVTKNNWEIFKKFMRV